MREFISLTIFLMVYSICTITRGYVITTPRKWTLGGNNQVCIQLSSPTFSNDLINFIIEKEANSNLVYNESLLIPTGESSICHDIQLENIKIPKGYLRVYGAIEGKPFEHENDITFVQEFVKTFIQTDKYLYKPSQKVQFRILTLNGPFMRISKTQYEEIWVENPSKTRIVQWLNTTNEKGLIHLSFDLSDEPEEGVYTIRAKLKGEKIATTEFKVEEYTLPRFEITVNPPPYVLGTTENFTIEVCAKYTFGKPVEGNLTLILSNNEWRRYGNVSKNSEISGCKMLTISAEEIGINKVFKQTLRVMSIITESGTGVEVKSKSIFIPVHRTAIKFKNLRPQELMKPGLPIIIEVQAEFRDGSPVAYEPMKVLSNSLTKYYMTNSRGILKFAHYADHDSEFKESFQIIAINYPEKMEYSVNRIMRHSDVHIGVEEYFFPNYPLREGYFLNEIMQQSDVYIGVGKYISPSKSSIAIALESDTLQCNPLSNSIEIQLPIFFSNKDQATANINLQVISRGQIQYTKRFTQSLKESNPLELKTVLFHQHKTEQANTSNIVGKFTIPLTLPKTIFPKATIIIWYTRDDGEIVADARNLDITKCHLNEVSLSWSSEVAEPGDPVTLSLKAEPFSLCSLGTVDKSVHLLAAKKKPLTIDAVLDELEEFSAGQYENKQIRECIHSPYFGRNKGMDYEVNDVDAFELFNKAGLLVLTNETVETQNCTEIIEDFAVPNGGDGNLDTSAEKNELDANEVRNYFPETWLWDIHLIGESGVSELDLTLPDTITEWVGSSVCIHPTKGLGISSPTSITTFKDFFVELTLPASIKRGETFPVKISVFNYLQAPLPIRVALEESNAYYIAEEATYYRYPGERVGCVPAQDKSVFTVKIKPRHFGIVNITASATVNFDPEFTCQNTSHLKERRDIITKPLEVKIEGFVEEKVISDYMCSTDFKNGAGVLEWTLEPPSGIIPNSARGFISVSGDLMSPTIENSGHLVKMPYGCGEQNMLNFAPNIYIMQYFEASKGGNDQIAKKAIHFMERGYQRELTYRHCDGSYSAFGKEDDSGSTWLTAFVLKCFSQARDFISIDKNDLTISKNWLKKKQMENGCFESVGKIIHKGMKGGLSGLSQAENPALLSSFVLISLLEAGESPTSQIVKDTLTCLRADKEMDNHYTLAVRAYAYSLAGSLEAEETIKSLLNFSTRITDPVYRNATKSQKNDRALQVEIAGYTILALLKFSSQKPEVDYSQEIKSIVRWINNQRNSQGGFVSTQDTIVALQSLAEFEKITNSSSPELSIYVNDARPLFHVTQSNKLLQQKAALTTIPTNVTFNIAGSGCTLLQAVLRYNLPDLKEKQVFNLSVEAENGSTCKTKRITACASYLLEDNVSNMAIIEVDLVSGYIPLKADLKEVVKENIKDIKRYEVDGSLVMFYIDEFSQNKTCVSFRIKEAVEVENVKPGSVKVYDYYSPEYFITQTYTIPNQKCSTRVEDVEDLN